MSSTVCVQVYVQYAACLVLYLTTMDNTCMLLNNLCELSFVDLLYFILF